MVKDDGSDFKEERLTCMCHAKEPLLKTSSEMHGPFQRKSEFRGCSWTGQSGPHLNPAHFDGIIAVFRGLVAADWACHLV